ncbi:hypothetical protein PAMP_007363 [Pampus punctatissimus]
MLGLCSGTSFPSNINIGSLLWLCQTAHIGNVAQEVEGIDGVAPCYLCANVGLLKTDDINNVLGGKNFNEALLPSGVVECGGQALLLGGLFPTGSHEYEVFRFALAQHQDIPKLVPQVDMVDTGSSFAMTYACLSWCNLLSTVLTVMGQCIIPPSLRLHSADLGFRQHTSKWRQALKKHTAAVNGRRPE